MQIFTLKKEYMVYKAANERSVLLQSFGVFCLIYIGISIIIMFYILSLIKSSYTLKGLFSFIKNNL
jgi:hypothetical protein